MTRLIAALTCALTLFSAAPHADAAQASREAKLVLTVVDQTGAVIPNATVTATQVGANGKVVGPVKSNDKGVATLDGLVPGTYVIETEFPGFENRVMKDVRLRAGDNKHVAILAVQGLQDEITVSRDKQAAAADPKSTFGTALTREQIEALSDDPDEMRRQIMDMSPDAVLRIDSFEGGQLPPKAQIKSIHVTRDQFAAESHYAGAHFIDIITQPGMGPIRGGSNFNFRDRALNASNPQTNFKGPEQSMNYGMHFGGTLIKGKSSFSLSVNGGNFHDAPTIVSQGPTGRRIETLPIKRNRDNVFTYGTVDYALTRDQTLRLTFNAERFANGNQGIGQFDNPERGYSTKDNAWTVRLQEAGPLGRRFFINTRLLVSGQNTNRQSVVELPTIRIIDAETTGGAQQRGGRRNRQVNLMSDLDYVRGIHSFRTGIDINGTWSRATDDSNYLGTYTFESIDAFSAGRPRSYTRRIGDPNIEYRNILGAVYVQDDIRLRKNLTISPGVRYELQTHVSDYNNFAPRVGINWAPFKSGKTTIRASWGIFYDWFSTGIYEQTLRVDGFRQRELNIFNPSFPDPGDFETGIISATNRYLMDEHLALVRTLRLSAGVSHRLTPRISFSTTYSNSHMHNVHRGENLNAPVNGSRPDPTFSNVIRVVDDARGRSHQLSSNLMFSLASPSPALQQARFNWRRGSLNLNYTLGSQRSNSEGAFSVPFTGSPDGEWGASNFDVRHRLNAGINSQVLKNSSVFLSLNYSSGQPYTIRTGVDDNGDLVFNDRPVGVGRNTERGSPMLTVSGRVSYTIQLGKRPAAAPPTGGGGGTTVMIPGGVMVMAGPGGPAGSSRYRISFNLNVQNLTNRVNHTGWNGTMTSPFFGQSTSVGAPRKIDMGVSFSF